MGAEEEWCTVGLRRAQTHALELQHNPIIATSGPAILVSLME